MMMYCKLRPKMMVPGCLAAFACKIVDSNMCLWCYCSGSDVTYSYRIWQSILHGDRNSKYHQFLWSKWFEGCAGVDKKEWLQFFGKV